MKIKAWILAALTALIVLTGCGSNTYRVAFFIYDESDTFISEMMTKVTDLIPSGVTTEIRYAGNSQAIQNQQILDLADTGVPLFVINVVDRLACGSIVEKCVNSGIDIIFFNREPLEDAMNGKNIYYVGAAAESLGKKQADMVAALFGGDFQDGPYDKNHDGVIQLAIIKGEQGHQDAEKRTDNCVSQLKGLGFKVDVLSIEAADWSRASGYNAMARLYPQYGGDLELLFVNNDDMAVGAIDYLLENKVFSQTANPPDLPFVVVGVDGTAVGLDMISQGFLYGTVLNDSARQADAIVTLTDYLLTGRDLADFPYEIKNGHYIYIDGDIITSKNLSEYGIEQR